MKYILRRGEKISNWEQCNCGNLAEMYCICEGVYQSKIDDPDDWSESHYKVLKCPSCEQILIIRYSRGGFCYETEDESPYLEYEREILYTPAKQRHLSIPLTIADIVTQAEKVVPTLPRAAFILCRAALEQICKERNIPATKLNSKTGKPEYLDLKHRLNLLLEQEKLSKDLREIMHGIREIGNEFTHESQAYLPEKVSKDEVEVLIGLVDYVLNRLYVDEARSQEAVKELNSLKDKLRSNPETAKDSDDIFGTSKP